MGKDLDSSHSSSRHKDKNETSRSSRSDKGSQSRRPGIKDSQNAIGHLDRWPHDKFADVEHSGSGGQGYHNYRDRHRHLQEDDFMDQRRQEREKIGLIGVMQVWGKSPPRSEELVLMVKLYFTEALRIMLLLLPANIINLWLKVTQKLALCLHYLRKKKRLTLQRRGGHGLVSFECLHILEFNGINNCPI